MATRIRASSRGGTLLPSIEKVTARVFCQLEGEASGNPVSIFHRRQDLPTCLEKEIAQSCDWESVFVDKRTPKRMAFFMPTGEQVSFCAHAAIGGSIVLAPSRKEERFEFQADPLQSTNGDDNADKLGTKNTGCSYHSIVHEGEIVSLEMKAEWTQDLVPHPPTLHRILRDYLGLQPSDLVRKKSESHLPTFLNSSIARNKTLVYVNSLEALENVKAPTNSISYRNACDAIDSTGLYLYARHPEDESSYECRQFPRASGYPEDPATGIAAAALAVSLHAADTSRFQREMCYRFHQGTAMGKPSLILVENVDLTETTTTTSAQHEQDDDRPKLNRKGNASFTLLGCVKIDDREIIQLDEES